MFCVSLYNETRPEPLYGLVVILVSIGMSSSPRYLRVIVLLLELHLSLGGVGGLLLQLLLLFGGLLRLHFGVALRDASRLGLLVRLLLGLDLGRPLFGELRLMRVEVSTIL